MPLDFLTYVLKIKTQIHIVSRWGMRDRLIQQGHKSYIKISILSVDMYKNIKVKTSLTSFELSAGNVPIFAIVLAGPSKGTRPYITYTS